MDLPPSREVRLRKRRAYYAKNRTKLLASKGADYLADKEKYKERGRKYYQKNKKYVNAQSSHYQKTHRQQINVQRKERDRLNPEFRVSRLSYLKDYRTKNHRLLTEKQRIYHNRKRQEDLQYKLKASLRTRLYIAIKRSYKNGSAIKDLGCTITEFKSYLEDLFKEDMTWDNWSREGWHIDHKIALSSFDLTNREQFLKAVHYTNLQPLWANENRSKGAN